MTSYRDAQSRTARARTGYAARVHARLPVAVAAVFLTLCSCSTVPQRGATGRIVDERDTGAAVRVLRLEGMEVLVSREGRPYPPYLLDLKAFPREDGARFGLVMVNPELRFTECRHIELLAGDASVPLRHIEYLHTRGNTGWFEGWWIDVGPESLAKLAATTRAGGRFCEAEVWLDEEQRALLKSFAVKVIP